MTLSKMIYCSVPVNPSVEMFGEILSVSRVNNARSHVTGALLMSKTCFVQILEGMRDDVSDCFMRIAKDPRHRAIQIISVKEEPFRQFYQWDMFRVDADALDPSLLARYAVRGVFEPSAMSANAIEDFCRVLAKVAWDTPGAA